MRTLYGYDTEEAVMTVESRVRSPRSIDDDSHRWNEYDPVAGEAQRPDRRLLVDHVRRQDADRRHQEREDCFPEWWWG